MALADKDLLDYVAANAGARRDDIHRNVAPEVNEVTVWRRIKALVEDHKLQVSGRGPSTRYSLAGAAVVRAHLATPYNQRKLALYNKAFLDAYVPNKSSYLSASERGDLNRIGKPSLPQMPAGTYARRILEKLLVDLSWASSRMEGNTYSLLDTERLIRFGEEAAGKDRKEAIMILNHKEAIQHLVQNLPAIGITRRDLLDIHALLSDGLLVNPAMAGRLRETGVEITHSSYRPLDDKFEIEEEFRILIEKAATIADPVEQSFFLLVHIPYLQAFDDVNKRTSRIAANVPLLKAELAPMSFVAMNDRDYIDGLLGVYELNNIALFKEAYIAAYRASAENYRVVRAEVESPDKAALAYRGFVKEAVRRAVLEWKAFDPARVIEMARAAGIPEDDIPGAVAYTRREFAGLHEGNCIRYRLRPEDLQGLVR